MSWQGRGSRELVRSPLSAAVYIGFYPNLSSMFKPIGTDKPLIVNFIEPAVFFDIFQEAVEKFEEIRIFFANGPGNRFIRKRFVQEKHVIRLVHGAIKIWL